MSLIELIIILSKLAESLGDLVLWLFEHVGARSCERWHRDGPFPVRGSLNAT